MVPPTPSAGLRDRWATLLGTTEGVRRLLSTAGAVGLLLAAGAGALVWRSAEGHRQTAERLLQGQADFLADQFGNSAQITTWIAVRTQFHGWREAAGPGRPLPSVRTVQARVDAGMLGPGMALLEPTGWFRIDAGRMVYLPSATAPSAAALAGWRSLISARMDEIPPRPSAFGYLVSPDGEAIFFTLDRGGLAGFTLPLAQWRTRIFQPLSGELRLGSDTAEATHISVRVRAPDGTLLFETTPPLDETACIGTGRMTGSLAAAVQVTYPASGVMAVLPGGLPASPRVVALLVFGVLTVTLVGGLLLVHRALSLALLRSDFTSTMSHELRTPLTQILLYAETIGRDRPLAPEQRAGAIDIIVRETRRLVQMVENILALSRVGRPGLQVVRRPEQVDRLVLEVLAGFEPMLRARRIRAVTRMDPPINARVDGDAVRQVLINLVDNAVRHGPPDQEITIAATRLDGTLHLTVEDGGPGISAERREEVWRPFVSFSAGDGSAGSGIGLAVVRQLVELHGGTARVEAAPTGGTRVVITLAVPDPVEE